MPRQSQLPPMPPMNRGLFDGLFDGFTDQGPMRPAPLPQQPRAQAGGISDLLAALQGGGNSSLYDQMAPPPAEAGPSPYADFQYLLDTPVDQRGFGYVPPVDEAYGVDFGPIDPSDIETRTPEEIMAIEDFNKMAPMPSTPTGTIEEVIPDGMPVEQDVYVADIQVPDMQARIDEMQARVAANQAAPAANPAMTMSPEELAALRERLGNMNFGGFGGNFNIPTQAVAPAVAPTTTPESLMAQMSSNPFIGNFDREELMARIEAMQAQNAGNPVKMNGPRTISGGGSTVKTGAPRPIPMYRGGR